ncbi:hypothetical protein BR93DRAFT_929616 [Coniochaeta sp. PMI_546]|nr:hypothetical protein BR93DRAFT_929616 [Coniochaeta sp. PMI_546]
MPLGALGVSLSLCTVGAMKTGTRRVGSVVDKEGSAFDELSFKERAIQSLSQPSIHVVSRPQRRTHAAILQLLNSPDCVQIGANDTCPG